MTAIYFEIIVPIFLLSFLCLIFVSSLEGYVTGEWDGIDLFVRAVVCLSFVLLVSGLVFNLIGYLLRG